MPFSGAVRRKCESGAADLHPRDRPAIVCGIMETDSLKCGGCGAAIERPASGNVARCPYCQTEQVLPAGAAKPPRPEDITAAMAQAREMMDKMMGSAFPGTRIIRTLIPIVALVIFAIVVLVLMRSYLSMR